MTAIFLPARRPFTFQSVVNSHGLYRPRRLRPVLCPAARLRVVRSEVKESSVFTIQLNGTYLPSSPSTGSPEYFNEDNERGTRIHFRMIKTIELTAGKKGVHYLKLATKKISLSQDLDQGVVDKVRQMVSAIQKAME